MTELTARLLAPRPPSASLRLGASLLVLALLAVGLVDVFNNSGVSFSLALAGGVLLTGFLALTITHYDTAIAIGLLLMGIVRFEPAPPDIAFAVIMAVAAMTGRFRLNRVPLLLRWIVGLFLVINVMSMTDVTAVSHALRFLFITAYLAIFFLWLAGYVDRRPRARLVAITWLVIGVVSTVISVAALNLPVPGRSFILGSVDYGERASGLFKDPNVFGPFLIPIAVILLEQRVSPRFPRLFNLRAFTTWLLLLTLTLGVVFSYSRAAWGNFAIAVIVTLAVLSMRRRGARRVLHAGLLLLVVAAVVITVLSAAGSIHFLEQRAHLQSYDTERFSAQSFGWRLGWTHPLGVGPGQFELLSPVATHSTFVRTFAEQGWIGLLLWISLLLVTLVLALRNVVVGRDTYGIGSAALLGAWCGLIFNSTVVDTLHWRHLWVVAALIWASTGRSQATSAPARQPSSVAARPRLATSGATLR